MNPNCQKHSDYCFASRKNAMYPRCDHHMTEQRNQIKVDKNLSRFGSNRHDNDIFSTNYKCNKVKTVIVKI